MGNQSLACNIKLRIRYSAIGTRTAFTLIELLVTIAIIGLLTLISIISFQSSRISARDFRRVSDIKQIQTALGLYYDSVGRYPTSAEFESGTIAYYFPDSGTTTYLQAIPSAPTPADGGCSQDNNAYSYNSTLGGASYSLYFCLAKKNGNYPGGVLSAFPGGIKATCRPDCSGKACGDDGCSGSCGSCADPDTCGGGGVANQCGCAPESNSAFCTRLSAACGSLSGTDNCGQLRLVADCGACNGGLICLNNICQADYSGLIAAYDMQPVGNSLPNIAPDSVANGNNASQYNGTLVGTSLATTSQGLIFNGTSYYQTALDLSGLSQVSLCGVYRKTATSSFVGYGQGDSLNSRIHFSWYSDSKLYLTVCNGSNSFSTKDYPYVGHISACLLYDGSQPTDASKLKLYLNGNSQTLSSSTAAIPSVIGNLTNKVDIGRLNSGSMITMQGEVDDLKVYRRILSDAEIKNYHNAFVDQPMLSESFDSYPLGNLSTSTPWTRVKTIFNVNEVVSTSTAPKGLPLGTRWINPISGDGINYRPSDTAYGTWDFYIYNDPLSGGCYPWYDFITTNTPNASFSGQNGYRLEAATNGNINLYRLTNGSSTALISVTHSRTENFIPIKITRDNAGLFTLYIDGALAGTATDNTIRTSVYFSQWICTKTGLADLKIYPGIRID